MNDMAADIRRLAAGDLPLMRDLNRLFAAVFDDHQSYGSAVPPDGWLEDLLGQEHVIALVALVDGEVKGGLVAYELMKFEQSRREIYIYDLAVHDAYRRQGMATALIEQLRHIARERGVWVIYVQADYGDDPAVALYTKLGAREDVMHFDITP